MNDPKKAGKTRSTGTLVLQVIVGLVLFAIPYIGWLLGLCLLGYGIATYLARPPRQAAPHKSAGTVSAVTTPTPSTGPVRPLAQQLEENPRAREVELRIYDLWGTSGFPNFEIVGEHYRQGAFRALYDTRSSGQEFMTDAQLVPDIGNAHDSNAVMVVVEGQHVGYLPRDEAERYRTVIEQMVQDGYAPTTPARVWARNDGGTWRARVTLDLGEPDMLMPSNEKPDGPCGVLPTGRRVQVTGEEAHLDVLAPYLSRASHPQVYVTLHKIVEQRPRSTKTLVEVRLDGARCGALSPVTSADILPLVERAETLDRPLAARARITGNSLKADVTIDIARAGDIPQSWIDEDLS